jgi:hypothetical protein
MDQQREPIGFGAYLREVIQNAGFATPTHFARAVDTDPSVVFRWISEEQRPTIRSIEKIAPVLGKTINEMVMAAYPDRLGGTEPVPAAESSHPLAHELGRMLAPDSPIPASEKDALISVLNRLLDPYRKLMRRRRSA